MKHTAQLAEQCAERAGSAQQQLLAPVGINAC